MIRYPVDRIELEGLIDSHWNGWRPEATTRTNDLLAAGKYVKASPIWGRVKAVFMFLQHYKCAFCERPLARSAIEHDVEHFRPQSSVKAWPYEFPTGEAHSVGYYWLAYEIENYAASCKDCNTIRKSNYFPIAGKRGQPADGIRTLNITEKPFLIYPLGDLDDDPTDLIVFDGIVAVPNPKYPQGIKNQRAKVTIDLFQLNTREELWEDRFWAIRNVFLATQTLCENNNERARRVAEATLADVTSDYAPQASCARSFRELMKSDPERAWEIFNTADEFVRTRSKSRQKATSQITGIARRRK